MVTRSSSHWRLLAATLAPHRRVLVLLGIVLAAASALPLAGPQLLRRFVDDAIAGAPLAALLPLAGAYIALGLGAQVAAVGTAWVATRTAWTATNRLRVDAADHALRLDLGFHGVTSPGSVVERVDGDASAIARFFTDVVIRVVGAAAMLAGATLLVAREDWRVGLAMAVFTAFALAVAVRLRDRAVEPAAAERGAWAGWQGLITEHLDGAEDLRGLGARDHALDKQAQAATEQLHASLAAERAGAAIWSWMAGFFALGGALMLLAGWLLLRSGSITLGTVLLLFAYTQVIRQPLIELAEQLQEVQRAAAGAARIGDLLATRPAVDAGGRGTLAHGPLALRLEGVSFGYRPAEPVLHEVDLEVPAGTVLGVVGASGSGKTTVARLALRLADPSAGRVLLGGMDLREVSAATLRRRVAVVTQDVHLLEGSVRDNLTVYGSVDADDDAIRAVLRDLGLGSWLARLTEGLDTVLGSTGTVLSAGEAQLLGLGRAFLRDPGLVVLDEASSRVDPATAELVEANLDRLLAGRTTVVIAHRLRAVERADAIAVLADGRVVEHGPRAALAADPHSRFAGLLALERAEAGDLPTELLR
jgi:ATP-binding cassette, subfamily B, bacterial